MKQYLNTTLRNIAWFKQAHELEQMDMQPDFQRHNVWTKKQQAYLVDTILRGYPIPEIYMQEKIKDDGSTEYLIVDGKQRITAILQFLDGYFGLNSDDSPEWANSKFSDLEPQLKRFFYEYNFVVRLLPEMTDSELRSIFQRLNRNVASLNKQELRQATYWGEFITTMNLISDYELWSKINIFSANDIRRLLDVEYISELTIAMLSGLQNKKDKIDDYYKIYEENFPEKERIMYSFNYLLERILDILPDINETRWNKKTDFYTLFLVMYEINEVINLNGIDLCKWNTAIKEFGTKVDGLVSTKEVMSEGNIDSRFEIYARNIRASSDLKSRRARYDVLKIYLMEISN